MLPADRQGRYNRYVAVAIVIAAVVVATATAAAVVATSVQDGGDGDEIRSALNLNATYYPETGNVVIMYADGLGSDTPVIVEVLGMPESYRKTFHGPEFSTSVGFPSEPKHGWAVHPVVVEMSHPVFGDVQLKTEIHREGDPLPRVIYAVP